MKYLSGIHRFTLQQEVRLGSLIPIILTVYERAEYI
jgi:hypothetical protein